MRVCQAIITAIVDTYHRFPKHMVFAYDIAPHSFIISICDDENTVGMFLEENDIAIAVAQKIPRRNQEGIDQRHVRIHMSPSRQTNAH